MKKAGNQYDTIVVGLGAMGSATLYHLAARGQRVLGLEQYAQGHALGSSHGDSRIIREQYFEHPLYVPFVQRAHELWRELEHLSGAPLMSINGGLMIGPPDGPVVSGTIRSAIEHNLPYEVLSPAEVNSRFPAFDVSGELVAVFDPHAGILDADACNRAHISAARSLGADIRFTDRVAKWSADDEGVRVSTPSGDFVASHLVLTTGAWTHDLVPALSLPLTVERQVLFWFDIDRSRQEYSRDQLPIYAFQHTPDAFCYGFPRLMRGAKAAIMHGGERATSPADIRRSASADEVTALREALRPILPGIADAPIREAATCLFTNTPDGDFLIDWHPQHRRVLLSSPCSGHGFKFASAIGEAQADLITTGSSRFDLSPFRIDRFQ